ncbi:NADH-quinone oxidoreductase subunit B family protein [Halapricum hydrolyticum]|uniref:NADH:ubiquinone oxidoreductase n=1 Tax=Halapricum hydrolyticum TaxID=2979991 RepID=A0AAE3IH83_9EURY|nr:NADH:ubiquinone oxidoreductase [Halapricum hydrolyticum]MCU4719712.1 NADH:ubiquinone oxidoreductase [Halapricum hydrolyticum]MCU4728629.1 NADH:ubiquinone oxidoreductase [Halapricum hydrolyticum]
MSKSTNMKPRVAFFDFTGCEGDQLQVINLEEKLLELVEIVEIASFREASSAHSDDYDIAFVEGSATTPHDAERLEEIRENATTVVALGSCATIAGINAIRNSQDFEAVKERVYGGEGDLFESWSEAKPIGAVIDVDYEIPGCPIDRQEFLRVLTDLVRGREPKMVNYPVCLECKLNENTCAYLRDDICLGPVTRGGCNSICVNGGTRCWGCRGLVKNPNENAACDVLEEHGLTTDEVMNFYNLYFGWQRTEEVVQ